MSGKCIILISIFICACADAVQVDHAPHPHIAASGVHNGDPKKLQSRDVSGMENQGDGYSRNENERDQNKIESPPETILSVQYDGGFIKELYVSQVARRLKEVAETEPPVSQQEQICEDLCSAGLGGDPCGSSCLDIIPPLLKDGSPDSSQQSTTTTTTTIKKGNFSLTLNLGGRKPKNDDDDGSPNIFLAGNPRTDVCSMLCENGLGQPLCGCSDTPASNTAWPSICEAFCNSDTGSYRLKGCPECRQRDIHQFQSRVKFSSDLWIQYCKGQCKVGNGGAACNCDKIPFSASLSN